MKNFSKLQNCKIVRYLLVLTMFLNLSLLKAQNCGSAPPSALALTNFGSSATGSRTFFEVKLNFLLYSNNDGTNGVLSIRPQQIVDRLNLDFTGSGFTFVFDPCEVQIIKNSALNMSQNKCDFINPARNARGIDIHVLSDNLGGSGDGFGSAFGIPSDELMIYGKSSDGQPGSTSSWISHEMGHALGLFHTFHGTCAENSLICPNTSIPNPSTDGDFCNDTNADGIKDFEHVGANCQWDGNQQCTGGNTNPPFTNFMSYSFHSCKNNFSPNQVTRMKALALPEIFTDGSVGIVKNCSCPIYDHFLDGPGTFTYNFDAAYKSITIKRNQHLILKGRYQISEKITIEQGGKLTLDGGVLGKCANNPRWWQGITVIGSNIFGGSQGYNPNAIITPGGEIEVINGGKIEYAYTGINCNFIVLGNTIFGPSWNFSGGLVKIDDGVIENCITGVNFGPYGSSGYNDDLSYIKNSLINSCREGVILKGNFKVEFDNTIFNNYQTGIMAINSTIDVKNGCEFVLPSGSNQDDIKTGINLSSTFPTVVGSSISNSTFAQNPDGIYISATNNATEHKIYDNSFINNRSGIFATGRSLSMINDNDFFMGRNAVYQDFTGSDVKNTIVSNSLLNSIYGFSFHGRNYTTFLDNCHTAGYYTDVEMMDAASVNPSQGATEDAAGNCFSKSGTPEISAAVDTKPFDYFIKSPAPLACKVTPNTPIVRVQSASFDQASSVCGALNGIISQLPQWYTGKCPKPSTSFGRDSLKNVLKLQIDAIMRDPNLALYTKELLTASLRECYTRVVNDIIIDKKGTPAQDATLINELKDEPFFSVQTQVYGLMMGSQSTSVARSYINSLLTNSQDEADFVMVQKHYLDFIDGDTTIATNTSKLNAIKAVAQTRSEYASNAQGVYYLLTGEMLKTTERHIDGTVPRGKDNIKVDNISIYPNPANDVLNIEFLNLEFTTDQSLNLQIFNSLGNKILVKELTNQKNPIDISQMSSGIYILQISNSLQTITTTKFIKL